MDEEPAFLAAISAEPADDTVRLAFADWLQENGEGERAEFVRVQVELAKLPDQLRHYHWRGKGKCKRCRHDALSARERELLAWSPYNDRNNPLERRPTADGGFLVPRELTDNNAVRWFLGDFMLTMNLSPRFRRGFVESVTCSAADWLAHGDAIRERHPVARVKFVGERSYGVEVWYDGDDEQWPIGEKVAGHGFSYSRIDRFIQDNLAHKPVGYRTLAVLMLRWPGIEFELPPPLPVEVPSYAIIT